MKISKDSWHYKLLDFFWETRTYDLCTYVRRLIITLSLLGIFIALAVGGLTGLGAIVFFASGYFPEAYSLTLSDYIMCFFTSIPLVAFFACIAYIIIDAAESNLGIYNEYKEPKELGLIKSYLNSKSNSYCAHIEYKD